MHRARGFALRALVALAAVALLAAAPADAEGDAAADGPPAWAYQMAHDLMSPYCPGRTLAACPSPQAAELRQWILFQAVAGRTREDLEASLYEQFGDAILGAPKAKGWGLSAYVVPAVGFLLGGALVAFLLRRLVAGAPGASPTPGTAAPPAPKGEPLPDWELEKIVDEELARL